MKANELMLGDWVKDKYKPKPYMVDSWKDFNSAEDLSPIPLTYEILKKNGWKDTEFWCEYQDDNIYIQASLPYMRGRINGIEIERFQCEYIHQYQHLLRLCGLEKEISI
jgi:hypothetical protein